MIIKTNSIKFNNFHPLLNFPGEKKIFLAHNKKLKKQISLSDLSLGSAFWYFNVLVFNISFAIST